MAWSSYSVVAISINSLPQLIAPLQCSINKRELSLAIYVQGNEEVMYPRKYFTLNFLSRKYFLLKNFRTMVYLLYNVSHA